MSFFIIICSNASSFPDASLSDASNFCRNPDNGQDVWCYTTDPNTRWEYCDVNLCSELNYLIFKFKMADKELHINGVNR